MKSALLVIDVQKEFFNISQTCSDSLKSAVECINATMALFRKKSLPVFVIQHRRARHKPLKTILTAKGFNIVGEFNCAGFDTFGPLKLVGGISKGRPNEEDLKNAEEFALKLKV